MTAKSGSEAVTNGRKVTSYSQGMCQKYVRSPCWEVGSLYGSAIEAWNGAAEKHPGDRNPPRGAPVYYRGGQYGHAVIATDPGRIRSTDCTSATQVNDTDIGWPERAWGYTYLGWTGDINGVDLPLSSSGGGSSTGDDDMDLQQSIDEWSPDEGTTGKTTVGKTLNQSRGYSEDAYDRLKALEKKVDSLISLQSSIDEWSPDDGTSTSKTTVGKTLNQSRGYSEDAYDRVKTLESKVDQILKKLG